ncbi:MAG: hypothetical protein R6W90_05330 [Ignavibacteriaceae bacterium]
MGTEKLANNYEELLNTFDGLWCVPGSPYKNMEGALKGIKYARENNIPFLGTCGGFQHTVIEYVRNALGRMNADHAESNPETSFKLIYPLACSMLGANGKIYFDKGSRINKIFEADETVEEYFCSYGLNPDFEYLFADSDFKISGRDENEEVKIIEHTTHPFMIATLFQPELSVFKNVVHPLIMSYLSAVIINKK